ncbi:hypothetical protein PIB30_069525 [Stylosanthes scabra]|uniref:Uncharacterized protein n=1 Tax=Stylosanthes scabra TaxID=79078 RepID=A0ABU6SNX4_9FABA|nr:hypothetical protein [Stylosanthes scabra]
MEPSHYSSNLFFQHNLHHAIDNNDQQKHTHIATTTTSPYLSYHSTINLFNNPNLNPNNNNHFHNPYLNAYEIKNDDCNNEALFGEHYYKSESDSCSSGDECDDDDDDDEVTLEEQFLMHDAKAKKQIEQLAMMVGLDTTEPAAVVLTQVVSVLKHLKGINSS